MSGCPPVIFVLSTSCFYLFIYFVILAQAVISAVVINYIITLQSCKLKFKRHKNKLSCAQASRILLWKRKGNKASIRQSDPIRQISLCLCLGNGAWFLTQIPILNPIIFTSFENICNKPVELLTNESKWVLFTGMRGGAQIFVQVPSRTIQTWISVVICNTLSTQICETVTN